MKILRSNRRNAGLTLVDVLVIVIVLAVSIAVLVPALAPPQRLAQKINCTNNLKQIGLSFRIWEGDNNDQYPMSVSITNGGAMELAASGQAAPVFQVMSNELSTPKLLVCPDDRDHEYATNFTTDFSARKLSYFAGLDATEKAPQTLLSGDDNFEIGGKPVQSGLQALSTNRMFTWSRARHKHNGNLLFGDGSVQAATPAGLVNYVAGTGLATNRLAIP